MNDRCWKNIVEHRCGVTAEPLKRKNVPTAEVDAEVRFKNHQRGTTWTAYGFTTDGTAASPSAWTEDIAVFNPGMSRTLTTGYIGMDVRTFIAKGVPCSSGEPARRISSLAVPTARWSNLEQVPHAFILISISYRR